MNIDLKMNETNQASVPNSVYRFIPIHRLWEIIASKKLYFLRNTKWEDPFDGYIAEQWCEKNGRSYENFRNKIYFLCCTTDKHIEFFWRAYTPNKDGVRIEISVSELLSCAPGMKARLIHYDKRDNLQEIISKVKNEASLLTEYFFYKRETFQYEKELRFYFRKKDHSSDVLEVPFDPAKVLKSIVFDPRMSKPVFKLHEKFIEPHLPNVTIYRSNIFDPRGTFRS